jgi:D-xylose transport system permease protein
MELDAVAACVIGGTSLKGGRGSVLGVLFGALIMASLINGLTLLRWSPRRNSSREEPSSSSPCGWM